MKILSAKQIQQVDQYTIANEPISSIHLMERAAMAFVDEFFQYFPNLQPVLILCGKGNNGGDGLVIARLLRYMAREVQIYIIDIALESSPDFQLNQSQLSDGIHVQYCKEAQEIKPPASDCLVIDAIFGSGLSRPLEGEFAKIIDRVNKWPNTKIAVDIASGLFADKSSRGFTKLKVDITISFQLPKLAFFMPENDESVGDWKLVDIGLDAEYIECLAADFNLTEQEDIKAKLPARNKFAHKGNFGHAMLIAGSLGKMGAAILAGKACLRSGVGLLTLHIPRCGHDALQSTLPEAMVQLDSGFEWLSGLAQLSTYSAIGVGPGIGQHPETVNLIGDLLSKFQGKLVFDADAINIFSENRHFLELLPKNSILTPHLGEFKRLVGDWENDFDKVEKQIAFAKRYKVIVILKGAYTTISDVEGQIYINSTGNSGMAKGGSGDALTGIITAFLAQGLAEIDAAISAV